MSKYIIKQMNLKKVKVLIWNGGNSKHYCRCFFCHLERVKIVFFGKRSLTFATCECRNANRIIASLQLVSQV